MVSFNSLNLSGGVPQEVAAPSAQQPSALRFTHGHNTRLQARLNGNDATAMNDPTIGQHLNEGLEPENNASPEHSPRISNDGDFGQQPMDDTSGPDGSDSDSDSDYSSNSEIESGTPSSSSSSDVDLSEDDDANQLERGQNKRPRSSSESSLMDVDAEETDASESDDGIDLASSEGSNIEEDGEDEDRLVQIDINELLGQLLGGSAPGMSLDRIRDKATFLESVDIVIKEGDVSEEGQVLLDKAEKLWTDYKQFNSDQFELILGLERFSISELMGKIHVDSRIDGGDKRRLLGQCSKLNALVQEFKEIDSQNKIIEAARIENGGSTDDLLRMGAAQLAKGVALLNETQSALQSSGYSLDVANLEVAMKSGLQVHKNDKNSTITFSDVVGIDEAKAELQEVVTSTLR